LLPVNAAPLQSNLTNSVSAWSRQCVGT